ncbi:MAG: PAS domain-containing protein, partial [Bacteroidota bacterium]|nr:PAS domain-containing protein [Bacteroidota bacterium]
KKLNTKEITEDEFDFTKKGLSAIIKEIADYEKHYIRKENVLFPNIEKKMEDYHCLQVMWSIHDDFRESIRNLIRLLEEQEYNLDEINREMGHLFFAVYPIIFREEKILFPIVAELFSKQELREMHNESLELGFSFIDQDLMPESINVKGDDPATPSLKNMTTGQIDLGTGLLQKIQLIKVLNSLPIDMTFVDKNDEVRYFSNPADRIFPRSKSIIGRKVQNCHPPESMHMVEEILDSFKSGAKDIESFWINIKGKFILIQYFAVRDDQGNYLGTLEVSQDATETRSLQGEKRLIDK